MDETKRLIGYYLVQIGCGYDIAFWNNASWDVCGVSEPKPDDWFYYISKERILGPADHLKSGPRKGWAYRKDILEINLKIKLKNDKICG